MKPHLRKSGDMWWLDKVGENPLPFLSFRDAAGFARSEWIWYQVNGPEEVAP